ncbi:MAG: hypothetical protein E7585_08310 [Ruminococcaceae bacterium]|nr:hypothetical protein [Oscillospiraceae bacterium]
MRNQPLSFRYSVYLGAIGILTLLITVLRSIALCTAFDPITGYFSTGALPIIIYIVEILALIAAFAPLLLIKQEELDAQRAPLSLAGLAAAVAAALALIATAIYLPLRVLSAIKQTATLPAPGPLMILSAAVLLLAAGYFLLHFLGKPQIAPLLGYAVILAAVLLLSITYFDRYTPMNAPHKISLHLSMLSIMLFMLYEIAAAVGRARPRVLSVASAICFTVTASTGISNLIGFAAGKGSDPLYLMGDLIALTVAFYVAARAVGDLLHAVKNTSPAKADDKEENT